MVSAFATAGEICYDDETDAAPSASSKMVLRACIRFAPLRSIDVRHSSTSISLNASLELEGSPAGGVLRRNIAGSVFLVSPKDCRVRGVDTCGIVVSPCQPIFAGTVARKDRRAFGGQDRRPHRVLGIVGGMHQHANRRELRFRSPCAAHADVAVCVHRERGRQVVTVRCVDKSFLQKGAVAGPDFAPKHSAPGSDGLLRGITGEDAAAVGVHTRRAPGLVGA